MPGPATMAATSSSTAVVEPVEPQSLKKLSLKSLKRALDVFASTHSQPVPPDPRSKQIRINYKVDALYGAVKNLPTKPPEEQGNTTLRDQGAPSNAIAVPETMLGYLSRVLTSAAIIERLPSKWPRPVWHAPWKNYRVISGHLGWVRSIAFDPSNEWFCTGSADRTIKIWSVATGKLKLTLTGHIEQIRGLAVSVRHPYMFSAGDDKQVKCWDLEQNKVIRSYHGHLSGVYCLALHPTLDVLLTGGRDSVCRVWDIRTKAQIFALSGHENTVCSVFTQAVDPQVVTGSHDTTVNNTFASASADNIKKFMLPRGEFLHNMLSQQKTIINSMAVNEDGVMATAGDNGSLWFWDWKSGHNFQQSQTIVQPGSLDSEAGIYALSYDVTGSRLVSCEADKTIKMWKQDEMATPETHPVNFKPPKEFRRF
ncbi:pleiotropic regulatory locus 1 protein [Nymphaea thermarum]|nr:pleiotropic regulatory locus 1 protein [Nymphaea thermarum]